MRGGGERRGEGGGGGEEWGTGARKYGKTLRDASLLAENQLLKGSSYCETCDPI